MKHVGELAIMGELFKDIKTSRVRNTQGRSYHTKRTRFRWVLLHTYYRIAKVAELQLNMHKVVKAKGSWVTLDTAAQNVIEYSCLHPE